MDVAEFDFDLPEALIAQEPSTVRGASRLLVLPRDGGPVSHSEFAALPEYLRPGDLVVVNDTRVFAARLLGRRVPGGGAAECLLLRERQSPGPSTLRESVWDALVNPGQKIRPGTHLTFESAGVRVDGEVIAMGVRGRRTIRLRTDDERGIPGAIDAVGHMPLPPYIKRRDHQADRDRYQTVYARARGSVAAPTAGLHFTPEVLHVLASRGIERTQITLHVGYGTFKPVRVARVEDHEVDPEPFVVSDEAATAIRTAKREGRRIIAVGTTVARALEALARADDEIRPMCAETGLFIHPGHAFQLVSGLVTNFHLPRSSLLMLIAAFAGRERTLGAYREAIARGYRFYSYGDAMLIL